MSHRHYRLISLWDMLDHHASAFYRVTSLLGMMKHTLSIHAMNQERGFDGPKTFDGLLLKSFNEALGELRSELEHLGCKIALMEMDRLEKTISGNIGWLPLISDQFQSMELRVQDELQCMCFFALEASKQHYFEQKQPLFGVEVAAKFPSLKYEIEEAGKCLALDRSTASVYHSIRCLEAGFAAVWRCLGVRDPLNGFERNWSNRLKKVEDQIEARWPAKSGRMAGDAKLFDQVVGSLRGLQNPYRNSSMHLDDVYTEERARYIFEVVKGIMQMIASRMDENGDLKV
jgi:hypothetical protein